jgi:hypothetical protein
MFGAGQSGFAQQSASAAQTATPQAAPVTEQTPAAKQESPSSGKPGNEGIKVHGHWVINVKNPDGTLAEHREFDNSLTDGGQMLVGLLSGYYVPSGYAILLVGNICVPSGNGSTNCIITGSNLSSYFNFEACGPQYQCSQTLTYSVNLSPGGSSMVLVGTFQAPKSGTISGVQTAVSSCENSPPSAGAYPTGAANASPAACLGPFSGLPAGTVEFTTFPYFTGTTLAPPVSAPVSVTAGQLIQVSVTISFS